MCADGKHQFLCRGQDWIKRSHKWRQQQPTHAHTSPPPTHMHSESRLHTTQEGFFYCSQSSGGNLFASTSTSQCGMATVETDAVYEHTHTHTNTSTETHKGQETSSTGRKKTTTKKKATRDQLSVTVIQGAFTTCILRHESTYILQLPCLFYLSSKRSTTKTQFMLYLHVSISLTW